MLKKYSNKKLNLRKETQKKKNTKRSFKKKKLKIRQKIQKSKKKTTKRKKFGGNLEHLSEAGRRHPEIGEKKGEKEMSLLDLDTINNSTDESEETNSSEDLESDDDSSEDCQNYLDDPNCPAKKKIEYLLCLYKKNKNINWLKKNISPILLTLENTSSSECIKKIRTLLSNETLSLLKI